ncbi:hypothetical protein [Tomitella gaofuii]|uniref:hypothetical protein n=1 Tax=Tomitella gaofuii TaxID=2760083 RepID=UPI002E2822BA|nr:hypothetical protein [Tomitella gaofuii]
MLVIGSGHMTHGLPFLTRELFRHNVVPGWPSDFDAWAAEARARGDVGELARYRTAAPGMPYAHPTVEHFTPLFVALGAADDPAVLCARWWTATTWACHGARSRRREDGLRRIRRAPLGGTTPVERQRAPTCVIGCTWQSDADERDARWSSTSPTSSRPSRRPYRTAPR